jgi:hypothetical protein
MALFQPQPSITQQITTATTTTIVGAPSSGTRLVNLINVKNLSISGATADFILQINDGGTAIEIENSVLEQQDTYRYIGSPSIILGGTQSLEIVTAITPASGIDVVSSFGDFV